jgi:hypothetical protein
MSEDWKFNTIHGNGTRANLRYQSSKGDTILCVIINSKIFIIIEKLRIGLKVVRFQTLYIGTMDHSEKRKFR